MHLDSARFAVCLFVTRFWSQLGEIPDRSMAFMMVEESIFTAMHTGGCENSHAKITV